MRTLPQLDALLVADQVLIGVAWVAIGWLLWTSGRRLG